MIYHPVSVDSAFLSFPQPARSILACQPTTSCGWSAVGFGPLINGPEKLTSLPAMADLATPPGNNRGPFPQEPQEQRETSLDSYKSETRKTQKSSETRKGSRAVVLKTGCKIRIIWSLWNFLNAQEWRLAHVSVHQICLQGLASDCGEFLTLLLYGGVWVFSIPRHSRMRLCCWSRALIFRKFP